MNEMQMPFDFNVEDKDSVKPFSDYIKKNKKKWKSFCNSICTTCNTYFFVKSAKRYCYEDKYDLPQVPDQIRYKKNNKVNIVATGVIDHMTYSSGDSYSADTWESNFNSIRSENKDNNIYVLKEACKEMGINYTTFKRKLSKIHKEVIKEDEEQKEY